MPTFVISPEMNALFRRWNPEHREVSTASLAEMTVFFEGKLRWSPIYEVYEQSRYNRAANLLPFVEDADGAEALVQHWFGHAFSLFEEKSGQIAAEVSHALDAAHTGLYGDPRRDW